ncbi:cupin domain-containing protein [Ramlibacter sp. AW1]|uniref:Cupin domain-containing protein n=1 Tax=Ramlibacter aurantiacus TaxID=2801330 RepID=A0A936ZU61_9BURK|nr:cupin domain-containing protein [Ramlibacter aurantiacus]MBL0420674.1 cupin domain-containing protein [Ramlibacter aurantiacus]
MTEIAERQAQGAGSLAVLMKSRIARLGTRHYDWNTLGFQSAVDAKYRRAQIRYVGTGAAGVMEDSNTVPAEHFTFSNMLLPAGSCGPLHVHEDAEEVFFIVRGHGIVMGFERGGERWEETLNERDLVSVPAGVYRSFRNEGEDEALVAVIIGASKPKLPSYHPDDPIHGTSR